MKRIWQTSALIIGALILSACSITPPVAESREKAVRLECTTSTPVFDGTAVTGCAVDFAALGKDGKSDLSNKSRQGHVFSSTPTLSNVAVGITSGALAAERQGRAAIKAAELAKCSEGSNCGTQVITINDITANGGSARGGAGGSSGAIAASGSNSNSVAEANVSSGGHPPKKD
jgi:hypothetical protein